MILFSTHHYLLYVLFMTGLLAGTVDAIAGGGGLISLPVLLGAGVPPHVALGTNKLQGMIGTAVATHTYYRQGWVKWAELWQGLCFSFCGALFGAVISQMMSAGLLAKLIPILLLGVFFYVIFFPHLGYQDEKPRMRASWFYLVFGTLLGFYDGFLGPGAGSLWVFALVFFLGQNLLKATAYTKIFNLNTNMVTFLCFAIGGHVDYTLALCMIAGQLIGGKVGAHLAIRQGIKLIRPVFILVVSATMVTLILKNYVHFSILELKLRLIYVTLSVIAVIIALLAVGYWSSKYVANKKNGIP